MKEVKQINREFVVETNTSTLTNESNLDIISISKYREITGDNFATEEDIKKRLQFLESFFRNIIKLEIEKAIE